MEKIVKKYSSFEEAEKADIDYYSSIGHEEKLQLLIKLIYGSEKPNGIIERCVRIYPFAEQE
jgi:hypothetical protein